MTAAKKSAMDSCYKLRHLFYYKLRQVLQSAMDLLQIATGITNCDDYYKLRQYRRSYMYAITQGKMSKKKGMKNCIKEETVSKG